MDSFIRKRQQSTQMDELLSEDAIMISTAAHDEIDLGSALPTNLYFTICDDLSNDSADFLAINASNITTQIKQEPNVETNQTPPNLQYRLVRGNVNPTPISPNSLTLRAVSVENANSRAMPVGTSNLLSSGSTAVQLPSGCEIYLVKEYVDSDCSDMLIAEECEDLPTSITTANRLPHGLNINQNNTQTSKVASVSLIQKAIKSEPGPNQSQILNVISPKIIEKTPTIVAAAGPAVSNYKKRDEKRRRTHNEVERRRRDKINSWIFKLKEMLPTETTGTTSTKIKLNNNKIVCNGIANSLPAATSAVSSTAQFDIVDQVQQQQTAQLQRNNSNCNTSRSPPSDSKSQILIKACEYIKQMQDEIKSLRECLTENEKLRSSNQRLQNELNRLKLSERRLLNEQQQQCGLDSTNIIDADDDFTLTLCANNNGSLDDVAASFVNTPTSPTSITLIGGGVNRKTAISVPYTKRELIISDYVD